MKGNYALMQTGTSTKYTIIMDPTHLKSIFTSQKIKQHEKEFLFFFFFLNSPAFDVIASCHFRSCILPVIYIFSQMAVVSHKWTSQFKFSSIVPESLKPAVQTYSITCDKLNTTIQQKTTFKIALSFYSYCILRKH